MGFVKSFLTLLLLVLALPARAGAPLSLSDTSWPNISTIGAGLLTDLKAYWPLNETNSVRYDAASTNDLTSSASPAPSWHAGIITNAVATAGQQNNYLTHVDSLDFDPTTNSFTFVTWVLLTDTNAIAPILSKFAINHFEYDLNYSNTADRYKWSVSTNGSGTVTVTANAFGSPGTNAWQMICAWYDASAQEIGISVNNASTNTLAVTQAIWDGEAVFMIACRDITGTGSFTGYIDETGYWWRTLTDAEKAYLYNTGNARTCCPFH